MTEVVDACRMTMAVFQAVRWLLTLQRFTFVLAKQCSLVIGFKTRVQIQSTWEWDRNILPHDSVNFVMSVVLREYIALSSIVATYGSYWNCKQTQVQDHRYRTKQFLSEAVFRLQSLSYNC